MQNTIENAAPQTTLSLCSRCAGGKIHNKTRRLCLRCYRYWYHRLPERVQANRERLARKRMLDRAPYLHRQLKSIAKRKGIEYGLTPEWIREKFKKDHCEVTGLPFVRKAYKAAEQGVVSFFAPSIDRIDNRLGYIPANCRIVIWGYNLAKNNYTDRDVLAFATALIGKMLPKSAQATFLDILPPYVLSTLPSSHALVNPA